MEWSLHYWSRSILILPHNQQSTFSKLPKHYIGDEDYGNLWHIHPLPPGSRPRRVCIPVDGVDHEPRILLRCLRSQNRWQEKGAAPPPHGCGSPINLSYIDSPTTGRPDAPTGGNLCEHQKCFLQPLRTANQHGFRDLSIPTDSTTGRRIRGPVRHAPKNGSSSLFLSQYRCWNQVAHNIQLLRPGTATSCSSRHEPRPAAAALPRPNSWGHRTAGQTNGRWTFHAPPVTNSWRQSRPH